MEHKSKQYHHPMVRHLAWCLFSPELSQLESYPTIDLAEVQSIDLWLAKLDDDPTEIERYVQSRNHRLLGSYFECLWQFFFTYSPNWQLLKDHLQVHATSGKQQTLGELDILAKDHLSTPWHIELAVKFYLQIPNSDGFSTKNWVGPQSRDRLDKKLHLLQSKQFPFLHRSETTEMLSEIDLDLNWQQGLILKGYLFRATNQEVNLPKEVPETVNLSIWCHIGELALTIPEDCYYVVLPKHEWLGPYYGLHIEVLDFESVLKQTEEHFAHSNNKFALMIAKVEKEKDNWKEKSRWLVVHDEWPKQNNE